MPKQNIIDNNKVADSDGSKPCLDLPDAFPDDIDYSWYEKKCIDILHDIGYIVKPRQIEFF